MTKFIGGGASWRVLLATTTLGAGLNTLGCSRTPNESVGVTRAPLTVPGLVAAYNFNEGTGSSVTDLSGQGNSGTIFDATWGTGIYGGALAFDGSSGSVVVPDSSSLDLSSAMTLEAWVRPTARHGWEVALVKRGGDNDLVYGLFASDNNDFPSGLISSGSENVATVAPALPLNAWSHLAATYDASTLKLYVNGVLRDSVSASSSLPAGNGPLRLGGDSFWGEWFEGNMDDVRVYNRALSAAEIEADMDTPIADVASDSTPPHRLHHVSLEQRDRR